MDKSFTMFLGTDRAKWLSMEGPPLMVSLNALPTKPKWSAVVPWFLDSGGFTELQKYGTWRTSAIQHAERVDKAKQLGNLIFASPQDWMCEPFVLQGGKLKNIVFAGTGKTVQEHQELTVQNLLDLRDVAPHLPWVPVLQGWEKEDYFNHANLYRSAGIHLENEKLVGVGSVCRRQATKEAVDILKSLTVELELRLHGFGFKQAGIRLGREWMSSADSMAWSYNARVEAFKYGKSCGRIGKKGEPLKSCNHCRHYALDWYEKTISFDRNQMF